MSYGLPVISTNEGGIIDIIDDQKTGYIIPQKDEEKLAVKLEEIVKLPLLAEEMGRKGYNKFVNEFTLENFEKNLLRILKKSY